MAKYFPITHYNAILFSPSRAFWILFDWIVIAVLYAVFYWLSPYSKWGRYEDHIITGSIVFASAFCLFALGMGYYERVRRFSKYKIVLVGFLSAALALPCASASVYFFHYDVFGRLTFI
ncbi:MAG: hypothetical protein R3B45_14170 [Bdellovibrionota bacterium]